MRRIALYAVVLGFLGTASLAVADLAVETDEERIDAMLRDVARANGKAEAVLRHVDLAVVPLEVSSARREERFDAEAWDALMARAADLDEALGVRPLEVRQSEITVGGDDARVIANLVVDGDAEDLVACDIALHRAAGRWLVRRIRVMN